MLEVREITTERKGKRLLAPTTASFPSGTLTAIIGRNGAGKSTLLKTLIGIWPTTTGEIFYNDVALSSLDRKGRSRLMAYVPQAPSPTFSFSTFEMVAMGRYCHGTTSGDRQLVEGALRAVDAWDLRDRDICELSGGERQRIYLARAIVTQAPIILLDEPTVSLDVVHQKAIWELMARQAKHGRTIIAATHDLSWVERVADHILQVDDGVCSATHDMLEKHRIDVRGR